MRKRKEQAEITNQEIVSVGQSLEAGRKAKGLSIEAASKSLCITKRILTRLEKECDDLPRDVYTVGFVRSYATFLGLDADALVSAFRGNASISLMKNCDESKFPSPLPQAGIPRFKYIAASVVLLVVIVVGVQFSAPSTTSTQQSDGETTPTVAEIAPPTSTSVSDIQNITPISDVPAADEEVAEASPTDELSSAVETPQSSQTGGVVMKISQESWVEVTDPSGRVIISRVFKKGESYPFEVSLTDFKIHTGNAGGITFVVGKSQTLPLGKTGEIRKDLSFNVDKIRAESVRTGKPVSADEAPTSDPETRRPASVKREISADKTLTETVSADDDVAVTTSEAGDEEPASKE